MKLPADLVLAKRIRAQRKTVRRLGVHAPRLTGAYDVASRDRRAAELTAIVEQL